MDKWEAKWLIRILIKSMCGANDGTANWQGARSYCIGMVELRKMRTSQKKKKEVMKKMKPLRSHEGFWLADTDEYAFFSSSNQFFPNKKKKLKIIESWLAS